MKKLSCILILLLSFFVCWGQRKQLFKPNEHYANSGCKGFNLILTTDSSTKWIQPNVSIANEALNRFVFLNGAKTISVTGIFKDVAQNYRYSVRTGNGVYLISNAKPDISKNESVYPRVANIKLGTFDITNKLIVIETYSVTQPYKIGTLTIFNKEIEPAEFAYVFATPKVFKKGSIPFNFRDSLPDLKFKAGTVSALFIAMKPRDFTFLYTVVIKNLTMGYSQEKSNLWTIGYNEAYLTINADFNIPGDYQLQILPRIPGYNGRSFPEKAALYRFTILKPDKVVSTKAIIIFACIVVFVVLLIAGIVIYTIRHRNKKALAAQQQQKDMAQVQLGAVRSQLNPHFLFNALSGIQNLMNKNEVDQANRYLAKFARLTRNVLQNNELINVSSEIALLDDYLQMEQLRFGFKYSINSDEALDNIEIPAMLLQPFVENAVKHGIAGLGDGGIITIGIKRDTDDLILFISDNGTGFNTSKENTGLGLTLSKKRIALLNTIYRDSPVELGIQSRNTGTTITITLKQWV